MKGKLTRWLAIGAACSAMGLGLAQTGTLIRSAKPLDARKVRTAESTFGDLVADAAGKAVKADLALVQASQFREDVFPAGDIDQQGLASALLYPDEQVVLVEVEGRLIRAALERGLSVLPQPNTGFLQVSGMKVSFRSQATSGARLVSVAVGKEALADGKIYRVAMPSSLAKGALGYWRIFDGLKVKQTGPSLKQALIDYTNASPVIDITPGERLRDLSQEPPGRE